MASSNPCIITGCDLFDVAHQLYCHGDLFEYGDCYVFNGVVRSNGVTKGQPLWRNQQFSDKVLTVISSNYFERRGVFVIPKCYGQLNQAAIEYVEAWK